MAENTPNKPGGDRVPAGPAGPGPADEPNVEKLRRQQEPGKPPVRPNLKDVPGYRR